MQIACMRDLKAMLNQEQKLFRQEYPLESFAGNLGESIFGKQ